MFMSIVFGTAFVKLQLLFQSHETRFFFINSSTYLGRLKPRTYSRRHLSEGAAFSFNKNF